MPSRPGRSSRIPVAVAVAAVLLGCGVFLRAGVEEKKAGILMPGTILLGARYFQEIASNTMDRAENLRTDVTLKTPAGTFKNCLKTEETSGLDPRDKCHKTYAPGIGLLQDEDLLLTKYTRGKK